MINKTYCGAINTHNFTTYKSITADSGFCTDLVTNKTSFPMEAFNYVLLNPGFTASSTSMLYLNTMKSLTGQDYSPETHIGKGFVTPPASWYERLNFHY